MTAYALPLPFHNSHYEKNLATGAVRCIDDELPFDLPDGWAWARFGSIMINRDSERIPLSVSQRQHLDKVYDYYGASGVIDKVDKFLFDKDLLLIGEDGANLINRSSPIAFIASGKYWVNNHAHVLDVCGGMVLQYVSLYINAISLVDYVTGTAQPKMNQEKMNSILVAVPPKQEQERILSKMAKIEPLIYYYQESKNHFTQLDNNIRGLLKQSILQEAIQGRLVSHIESDGTADELLADIRSEKQRLVKEGKLKKSALTESVIFRGDDNKYYERTKSQLTDVTEFIPFEIPDSWQWIRLGTLFQHNTGKALNRANKTGALLTYITTSNLYWDRFELDNLREMYFSNAEIDKCTAKKGDLLVCEGGDIGRAAIWSYDYDIRIQNHIHKIRAYYPVNTRYFYYIFLYYKSAGMIGGKGIGIQGLSSNALDSLLLPLPPNEEQDRIVNRVQELFQHLK